MIPLFPVARVFVVTEATDLRNGFKIFYGIMANRISLFRLSGGLNTLSQVDGLQVVPPLAQALFQRAEGMGAQVVALVV